MKSVSELVMVYHYMMQLTLKVLLWRNKNREINSCHTIN